MNELLALLKSIKSDVDFATCESLIDDGLLDSFDIITIVHEVNDTFDVTVTAEDIDPDNFNSAKRLWALIERLRSE